MTDRPLFTPGTSVLCLLCFNLRQVTYKKIIKIIPCSRFFRNGIPRIRIMIADLYNRNHRYFPFGFMSSINRNKREMRNCKHSPETWSLVVLMEMYTCRRICPKMVSHLKFEIYFFTT